MNCLVVTTHPLKGSLCAHLTDLVVDTLKGMGHDVVIEDLPRTGIARVIECQVKVIRVSGRLRPDGR